MHLHFYINYENTVEKISKCLKITWRSHADGTLFDREQFLFPRSLKNYRFDVRFWIKTPLVNVDRSASIFIFRFKVVHKENSKLTWTGRLCLHFQIQIQSCTRRRTQKLTWREGSWNEILTNDRLPGTVWYNSLCLTDGLICSWCWLIYDLGDNLWRRNHKSKSLDTISWQNIVMNYTKVKFLSSVVSWT